MLRVAVLALSIPLALLAQKAPKQTDVKVQKTSLTRDQELQIGKEAASAVEREMEVVQNPEIERWLNQIGQRLAKAPEANAYPYYFRLVNEPSINAFALPGGPMYVHTGLLRAADTEGEVAGVLAHEMSHVALRHGAAQIGKQQTWGALFGWRECRGCGDHRCQRAVRTALSARRIGCGHRRKLGFDEILSRLRARCRFERRTHDGIIRL